MKSLIALLLGLTCSAAAQPISPQPLKTGTNASIRALSVVTDDILWASGTQGTVANTVDGGQHWAVHTVTGMEKTDFRTLHAFTSQRALIANAGSPGRILLTEDGGNTWVTVYENSNPDIFMDGVDFWNEQEGLVYGDPIQGRMLVLYTRDGGRSWAEVSTAPMLQQGEASFAASGTGIRCLPDGGLLVCTGGTVSRLWHSKDKGNSWKAFTPPVAQGKSSTGIFSVAAHGHWMVVGGDFQEENRVDGTQFYSDDGGNTWQKPATGIRGYRECVEYVGDKMWIAVGPTGLDYSTDDGLSWAGRSDIRGLHVVRRSRVGNSVFAAGANGVIYRLR